MFNHPLNIYVIHLAALSCFCCNGLVFGIYKDFLGIIFNAPSLEFSQLWSSLEV